MKTISKMEYKVYKATHKRVNENDPLPLAEVNELLEKFEGLMVRSQDGFWYEVKKCRVDCKGEVFGGTLWAGLVGWVMTTEQLVELLEEIDATSHRKTCAEDALEICGFKY